MANKLVGVRLWELTPKMGWPLIERGNLCFQWSIIHLRDESQQELHSKFLSVTADGSLPSPTGSVNTIHPEPEIHEQIFMTNRLRNFVHDYKHILTDIERIVNNNVNNATHADELTMQYWAHCTQSVVASSDVFTSSHWLKADLICLCTLIPSMHMCLRPRELFSSFSLSTSCSTSLTSFFLYLSMTYRLHELEHLVQLR